MNWLATSTSACAALGPITTLATLSTIEVSGSSAFDGAVLGVTAIGAGDAEEEAAAWLICRIVDAADEAACWMASGTLATGTLATALAVGTLALLAYGWRALGPGWQLAQTQICRGWRT